MTAIDIRTAEVTEAEMTFLQNIKEFTESHFESPRSFRLKSCMWAWTSQLTYSSIDRSQFGEIIVSLESKGILEKSRGAQSLLLKIDGNFWKQDMETEVATFRNLIKLF